MIRTNIRTMKYAVSLCAALTLALLLVLLFWGGMPSGGVQNQTANMAILDKYDMFITNTVSDALDGVLSVDKVYWLNEDDLVAPEPNPENFGESSDPGQLQWLLDEAARLLDGQDTLFTAQTAIKDGSKVKYYLDETIFCVSWKMPVGKAVYTFSEVKIAHPSQFRRFLAGGEYGSGILYTTTEMAESVNAVTASSGDYYSFRPFGIVVYDGVAERLGPVQLDTCFVDENGDLHFTYRKELNDLDAVQRYVDGNRIRFSLAFGPVLIEDGEVKVPDYYGIGEITERYSRAAICQLGQLHYVMVTSNMEVPYVHNPTMMTFAKNLLAMGIENAYALDGGQTAVIVTGDEIMNAVDFGYQRPISDMIYFATALPGGS